MPLVVVLQPRSLDCSSEPKLHCNDPDFTFKKNVNVGKSGFILFFCEGEGKEGAERGLFDAGFGGEGRGRVTRRVGVGDAICARLTRVLKENVVVVGLCGKETDWSVAVTALLYFPLLCVFSSDCIVSFFVLILSRMELQGRSGRLTPPSVYRKGMTLARHNI